MNISTLPTVTRAETLKMSGMDSRQRETVANAKGGEIVLITIGVYGEVETMFHGPMGVLAASALQTARFYRVSLD
jgi:hypothetical protein